MYGICAYTVTPEQPQCNVTYIGLYIPYMECLGPVHEEGGLCPQIGGHLHRESLPICYMLLNLCARAMCQHITLKAK